MAGEDPRLTLALTFVPWSGPEIGRTRETKYYLYAPQDVLRRIIVKKRKLGNLNVSYLKLKPEGVESHFFPPYRCGCLSAIRSHPHPQFSTRISPGTG